MTVGDWVRSIQEEDWVRWFRRKMGMVCSAGKLGVFVPVSKPVTQRLIAFFENASFFKKI